MLKAMVDEDKVSIDKSPSPELISLMGAAATGMLAFGELWDTVKQKGASEGFDEKALLTLFAPMVKEKFTAAQVRYLMNKEKEQERARDNRAKQKEELKSLRTYAHIPPKKEPEQTYNPEQEIKKIGEIRRAEQKRQAEEPIVPDDEDPKDLEIQFLKEQVEELKDALHKTQQFTPATELGPAQLRIDLTEETVFDWLGKRDNGVSCYWYPNYGIELFKTRILTQLKGKGVTTFKRLYFEV